MESCSKADFEAEQIADEVETVFIERHIELSDQQRTQLFTTVYTLLDELCL